MSGVRSVAGRVPPGSGSARCRKSARASRQGQNQAQDQGPWRVHDHFQPRHGLSTAPARSNPSPDAVKTEPPLAKVIQKPHKVKKKLYRAGRVLFYRVGAPFCTCWPGLWGGCENTASAIRGKEIKLANASVVGLGRGG